MFSLSPLGGSVTTCQRQITRKPVDPQLALKSVPKRVFLAFPSPFLAFLPILSSKSLVQGPGKKAKDTGVAPAQPLAHHMTWRGLLNLCLDHGILKCTVEVVRFPSSCPRHRWQDHPPKKISLENKGAYKTPQNAHRKPLEHSRWG